MVAVFTGVDFGLQRGSAWVLGSRGQVGDASFNRYGENVYVNAATGNLVISRTDEILIGRGPDDVLTRTYNSMGSSAYNRMGSFSGGDQWQLSASRYVSYSGSYSSTPASGTVILHDWDGSEMEYKWDGSWSTGTGTGAFVCKQGPGAYDWMTCAQSGSNWIWTRVDGDTQTTDKFNVTNGGRITSTTDLDGNALTYTYNSSNQLIRIVTANGERTSFTWGGHNNLTEIVTRDANNDKIVKRVTYGYDDYDRLSTVTTDLTPANSNDSGGSVMTTYTYVDTTSDRISSISQTGGALIAIDYDSSGRVWKLTVTSDTGETRLTEFDYETGHTTITDPELHETTLYYDTTKNNRLTEIDYDSGQSVKYTYDANGNVTSVEDPLGRKTYYEYSNGNLTLIEDPAGNVVTRTYDPLTNALLTETRWMTPDPDDYNHSGQASTPLTTRYVYDTQNHLRFVIGAAGDVTEYQYQYTTTAADRGCMIKTIRYPEEVYSLSGLAVDQSVSESTMSTWAGTHRANALVTDWQHDDTRGQLTGETEYAASDGSGGGSGSSIQTAFSFDQYGNLLSRRVGGSGFNASTYQYDGLGRLKSTVDPAGNTTTITYTDGTNTVVVQLASGLQKISTYNFAGELVSYIEQGTGLDTKTSTYTYNDLGQLMVMSDAMGNKRYYLYDDVGRRVADITEDKTDTNADGVYDVTNGVLVEYVYDAANHLVRTIRYKTEVNPIKMAQLAAGTATLAGVQPNGQRNNANNGNEWRIYDSADRLTQVIDGTGDVTEFTYNGASQLTSTIQYANKIDPSAWLGTSLPTSPQSVTPDSAHDVVTRNYYDADGRLAGTLNGNGALSVIKYDGAGRTTDTISYATPIAPSDRTDDFATLIADAGTNAADRHTRYFYDGRDLLIYMVDPLLHPVKYVYDAAGNLLNRIDYPKSLSGAPAGDKISDVEAAMSGTAGWTETGARRTWFAYNAASQLIYSVDALGAVTKYSYDTFGNVTKAVQFINTSTYTAFADLEGWSSSHATDTGNRSIRSFYDVDNRLTYTVDANGYVTKYEYDTDDRVLWTTRLPLSYAIPDTYTTSEQVRTFIGTIPGDAHVTTFAYDTLGRLMESVDAESTHTAYAYDAIGRVLTKTVASGTSDARKTTYEYDPAGNLAAESMMAGSSTICRTEYEYDGTGRLTQKVMAVGVSGVETTTTYDRDAGTNTVLQTDASGTDEAVTTKLVYNAFGQVADKTEAYGAIAPDGITSEAVTTHFEYDADGRLVSETRGGGTDAVTTRYAYTVFGEVQDVKAAYGTVDESVTHFTYDADGRVLTRTVGANDTGVDATVTTSYDTFGEATTIEDARGNNTLFQYDAGGRVTFETDAVVSSYKSVTAYQYDAFGNVIRKTVGLASTTDTAGYSTYYFYDKSNRLIWTVDANLFATQTTYTAAGEIKSVTHYVNPVATPTAGGAVPTPTPAPDDPLYGDAKTQFEYDGAGRLTKVTDALLNYEQYTLDALGRRTDVRNKLGGTTHYIYDHLGRVMSERLPMQSVLSDGTVQAETVTNSFTYDHRGNRKSVTEADGLLEERTTSYGYDIFNRVVHITHPWVAVADDPAHPEIIDHDEPEETFQYDRRGNLIMHTDVVSGRTVSYYDILDRKTAEVSATGTLSEWTYDNNGNMTSQKVYAAFVTVPTDPRATQPSGGSNYRKTDYTYNRANWLATTKVSSVLTGEGASYGTTTADVTITNSYDRMGNLIAQTDGRGVTCYYYYDSTGHRVGQVDQLGYVTKYDYDENGNVKTETRYAAKTGVTISLNTDTVSLNQTWASVIPGASDGFDRITTFKYDKNGNRTEESRLGVTTWSVVDDGDDIAETGEGALQVLTGTTSTIVYTYNGLGEVTSKTEATLDTTTYVYDQMGRQKSIDGPDYTNGSGSTVSQFTQQYYDGLNNLTRTIQQDGSPNNFDPTKDRVTRFTYDYEFDEHSTDPNIAAKAGHGGRLVSMTDALGFSHFYNYDSAGRVVMDSYTRTKSDGTTTVAEAAVTTYDKMGRALTQYMATKSGGTWSPVVVTNLHYNAYGELNARGINVGSGHLDDLDEYQEQFSYDGAGHLWKATTADGTTHLYIYDKNGNRTADISSSGDALASGLKWSNIALSDAITALGANGWAPVSGLTATFTVYDARGQAIETREPGRQIDGTTNRYTIVHGRTYNAFGEVADEIDPRAYDSSGTLITNDPNNAAYNDFRTTFHYNTMGRIIEQLSPMVAYTDEHGVVHDGQGSNPARVRPVQTNYYDRSGRLVGVRKWAGDYDGTTARTSLNTRTLLAGTGYGGSDASVLKEFHADGGMFVRKYDAFGNMTQTIDEVGRGETYKYDLLGRLKELDHQYCDANGNGVLDTGELQMVDKYTYDELGRRITHMNAELTGNARTETTDYDALGRVTKMVDYGNYTTSYSYSWHGSYDTVIDGTYSDSSNNDWQVGGWLKTTTNAAGRKATEEIDYFGRTIYRTDFADPTPNDGTDTSHHYTMVFDYAGRLKASTVDGLVDSDGDPMPDNTTTYAYFNSGRIMSMTDSGVYERGTTYGYDVAGNLTAEKFAFTGGNTYEDATMSWDALNRMVRFHDNGPTNTESAHNVSERADATIKWQYDLSGNVRRMQSWHDYVTLEGYIDDSGDQETTSPDQDDWYLYDSMNRFTRTKGTLVGTTISYGMQLTYDSAGRRTSATRSGDKVWHELLTTPPDPPVYRDHPYSWTSTETYHYTADGYIDSVHYDYDISYTGTLAPPDDPEIHYTMAKYTRDEMGRVTLYEEFSQTSGDDPVYSRAAAYDKKSQVTTDTVITHRSDGKVITAVTAYDYVADTDGDENYAEEGNSAYMGGVVTHQFTTTTTTGPGSGNGTKYTHLRNNYMWWDSTLTTTVDFDPDAPSSPTDYSNINYANQSTYSYDGLGHLISVHIDDGQDRSIFLKNDLAGQVIQRIERMGTWGIDDPQATELHYRFGGIAVGDVGNNGSSNVDYALSIAEHTAAPPSTHGPFAAGGNVPLGGGYDFDQSYDAINGLTYESTFSRYTVHDGDTLEAIAQIVWGDASYWYLIADANGILPGDTLVAGRDLIIPNKVHNSHNTSDVYRVYDPNDAIGDTSPTRPRLPKHDSGCGVMGQILLVVIAVAVAAITYGALIGPMASLAASAGLATGAMSTATIGATGIVVGSEAAIAGGVAAGAIGGALGRIVSQGVGVATGIQSKFDWNAVGVAAIAGGIGGGIGPDGINAFGSVMKGMQGASFVQGALRGMTSNALTQGISVAAGLQRKFDWTGVAVAGVVSGVASSVAANVHLPNFGSQTANAAATQFVSGMAGAIAGAGARTLIQGTDFGDNLIAVLPDAIGSTIGNTIGSAIIEECGFAPPQSNGEAHNLKGVASQVSVNPEIETVVVTAQRIPEPQPEESTFLGDVGDAATFVVGLVGGALERGGELVMRTLEVGGEVVIGGILDIAGAVGIEVPKGAPSAVNDVFIPLGHAVARADHYLNTTSVGQAFDDIGQSIDRGWREDIVEPYESGHPLEAGLNAGHFVTDVATIATGVGGIVRGVGKTGEVVSALRLAGEESVWKLGWAARGFELEERILGSRLQNPNRTPEGFRTIDEFTGDGLATSVKSVNLAGSSYQNASRLERLLNGYVDRVSAFDGDTLGQYTIDQGATTSRRLVVAIPSAGTSVQQAIMARVTEYGASLPKPVNVQFRVIH